MMPTRRRPCRWRGARSWGDGQPVGRDAADAGWDTIGETGGAKTHTHAGHADHAALGAHAHELPIMVDGTHDISSISGSTFGSGTSRPRTFTASYSAASGSFPVALSQAVSAGTPSSHTAHDSPSSVPPYLALSFIIRI